MITIKQLLNYIDSNQMLSKNFAFDNIINGTKYCLYNNFAEGFFLPTLMLNVPKLEGFVIFFEVMFRQIWRDIIIAFPFVITFLFCLT